MKKTVPALVLGAGILLAGCAAPGPADHYTGTAVVENAHRSSYKTGCKLDVTLPDGQSDIVRVGRRTSCDGWAKGQHIQINDGRPVKP